MLLLQGTNDTTTSTKAAAPSSTQHNIVQDFFGGQRRRRLRVVLFSVLATILTLGKRGLGWKIESRWSFQGLLTLKRLNENVFKA